MWALSVDSRFSFGFDFAADDSAGNIVSIFRRDGTRGQHCCESDHVKRHSVSMSCSFSFPHNFGVPNNVTRRIGNSTTRVWSTAQRFFVLTFFPLDDNNFTKMSCKYAVRKNTIFVHDVCGKNKI